MDADLALIKENGRLRQQVTDYQNAMEEMELRAKRAEANAKALTRKLGKVSKAIAAAAQAADAPEGDEAPPPPARS